MKTRNLFRGFGPVISVNFTENQYKNTFFYLQSLVAAYRREVTPKFFVSVTNVDQFEIVISKEVDGFRVYRFMRRLLHLWALGPKNKGPNW